MNSEQGTVIPAKLNDIYSEITWGLSYRSTKSNHEKKTINPQHSPINLPFKLCRHLQSRPRYPKTKSDCANFGKNPLKGHSKSLEIVNQTTLLERCAMSQKDYMNLLSIPNKPQITPRKQKKQKKVMCCKCLIEPCSPRIKEMAIPKKLVVYDNWRRYEKLLPAEMILRFQEILKSGKNLDPAEARYYFRQLDRIKRKQKRKEKRLKLLKKRKRLQQDKIWLQEQINGLASSIVDHIRAEPYYSLNFNQMLIANEILQTAKNNCKCYKPKIKGKIFNETIIEISDKLAIWVDGLIDYVNQQELVEEIVDEKLVAKEDEFKTVSEEEEEEEEEEGEELISDDEIGLVAEDSFLVEDYGSKTVDIFLKPESMEAIAKLFGEEFSEETDVEEDSMEIGLPQLREDILEKLIKILSNCSEEFLNNLIDNEKMPGVHYLDVLNKLKLLHDGEYPLSGDKPFLEQAMIDWAKQNDSEQVDEKVLDKINETSKLLSGWLFDDLAGAGFLSEKMETEELETTEEPQDEATVAEVEEEAEEEEIDDKEKIDKEIDKAETKSEAEDKSGEESIKEDETVKEKEETNEDKLSDKSVEEEEVTGEEITENAEAEAEVETDADVDADAEVEAETDTVEVADTEATDEDNENIEEIPMIDDSEEISEDELDEFQPSELGEISEDELSDDLLKDMTMEELAEEGYVEIMDERISGIKPEKDDERIPDQKPLKHTPEAVCCLSLKSWADWLLDITHNAQKWSEWIFYIINQMRHYVAITNGDILLPTGEKRVLSKAEWIQFREDTEEKMITWRQYSGHVKELTKKITEDCHNKSVVCCAKCLQDHLIKNVISAHKTLQALAEAINCASYWQRTLDEIVVETAKLTGMEIDELQRISTSSSEDLAIIEEIDLSLMQNQISPGIPQQFYPSTSMGFHPHVMCHPRQQGFSPQPRNYNYHKKNEDDNDILYEIEEITIPRKRRF